MRVVFGVRIFLFSSLTQYSPPQRFVDENGPGFSVSKKKGLNDLLFHTDWEKKKNRNKKDETTKEVSTE